MKIWYTESAQSQYLRASSGRGPIVGVFLSPKVLTRAGAQGIELREIPTMGLFYSCAVLRTIATGDDSDRTDNQELRYPAGAVKLEHRYSREQVKHVRSVWPTNRHLEDEWLWKITT